MTRGDTENITVALYDTSNVLVPLVVGDTVYLTVKESSKTEDIVLQKIVTTFIDGKAIIQISHLDTSDKNYGTYLYDVQLTRASGTVTTLVRPSEFKIEGEVTYE